MKSLAKSNLDAIEYLKSSKMISPKYLLIANCYTENSLKDLKAIQLFSIVNLTMLNLKIYLKCKLLQVLTIVQQTHKLLKFAQSCRRYSNRNNAISLLIHMLFCLQLKAQILRLPVPKCRADYHNQLLLDFKS